MQRQNSGNLSNLFTEGVIVNIKIIRTAHKKSMHEGVTITISNTRTYYWIPSLRKRTKSIIKKRHHCVRYRAMPFPSTKPGLLPKQTTEECHPFQAIGVDYAGPIYYRSKNKALSKSYILLLFSCILRYSCSFFSRAIHLELVPNLSTQELIKSMKRLITRRGSPMIYFDNVKTFQAGAKWLTRINKDENFHKFFSNGSVTWKFNPFKAPWWGGTVGKGHIKRAELEKVLLDIKVNLNNRRWYCTSTIGTKQYFIGT